MSRYKPLTAVNVLLMIRNGTANDWGSICKAFGYNPEAYWSEHYYLRELLDGLRGAELIIYSDQTSRRGIQGKIEISPNWEKIQTALGISLSKLEDFEPIKSMIIRPLFGLPSQRVTKYDVFVLMPFAEGLRPVYQDHIARVVESLNLKLARADDFFSTQSIMSEIWNAICNSQLIIADCTNRNPNVFYEIGLAHTIGKRVVLITQNENDVPFDLRHIRYIDYEYTPRGMIHFEKRLTETIKQALYIRD